MLHVGPGYNSPNWERKRGGVSSAASWRKRLPPLADTDRVTLADKAATKPEEEGVRSTAKALRRAKWTWKISRQRKEEGLANW